MNYDEYEKDDLGPEAYEHFTWTEKWDAHGNLVDVKYEENNLEQDIEDLFCQRNDDFAYRDHSAELKRGDRSKITEVVYDDHVTVDDAEYNGSRQADIEAEIRHWFNNFTGKVKYNEPDSKWWDKEQQGKGTDPEDCPHIVERLDGFVGSSLDPIGASIYNTKAYRTADNRITRNRNLRLDPSAKKFKSKPSGVAEDNKLVRYLAKQLKSKGKPLPQTIEAWDVLIGKHKMKLEQREANNQWLLFICWKYSCAKSKAYQIKKELNDGTKTSEADFRELVAEFNRLRHGDSAPPWGELVRDSKPAHGGVCGCPCGAKVACEGQLIRPVSMLWSTDEQFDQWLETWQQRPSPFSTYMLGHVQFDDW